MKTNDSKINLPAGVALKLRAIRRRARTLTLLEGLTRTGAVLVGAMLVAMLADLAIGWLDPRARYTITALALGVVALFWYFRCALPFARKRTMLSAARHVDQSMPQLEERWSTITELAQNDDAPEVRGSERMIEKVILEAESAGNDIQPEAVISARPAISASRWLMGATALLALLFTCNFTQARLLLHRFWLPGDNVSLTQIHASPANVWVAKGEPLLLNATLTGRVSKAAPLLSIRQESGIEKQIALPVRTNEPRVFQHTFDDVSDSFQYRIRSGDGQTPWHTITAVERPRISAVKLTIAPPAYSGLPKEEKDSLPNAVRVLQGSELSVAFKSDQPLDKLYLDLGNGEPAQLTAGDAGWYEYRGRPDESFTFAATALNKFKLENKNKPSCRITLYEDLAPSVKILAPSDELAVLPGEKVNITFEATDDFGVAKAEVLVTTTKAGGETQTMALPVDLGDNTGKKQLRQNVELDPKALGLKHGDQLSYVVKVTDTKQSGANSQAFAKQSDSEGNAAGDKPPEQAEAKKTAENSEEKPAAGTAEPKEKSDALMAKAGEAQKPSNGSQPPPNEMAKRMLDAGQCAACKPRNITIDEWAGTFEGEKRKKLEIAIAPVLEQLERLLKQADQKTDLLKPTAEGSQAVQLLDETKTHIAEATGAISGLKSRTTGTPYAFAGLQLDNIGNAHITPARRSLEQILIGSSTASANAESLGKASVHIGRAREMIADLTRTFEKVKRDQQIADAMQKLAKMHQVFIEETQAMLGAGKGPINSYDRKIAEVDEQFAAKLKELLEEKKKIMAELSKLLSEDPRMLRRYLAMNQLQNKNYRDEMTLLAERQKALQQQVTLWNKTPEAGRAALLPQLQQPYAAGRREVVAAATTLRENMETWLPLDVKPEDKQIASALKQAESIAQLVAQGGRPASNDADEKALAGLHALRSELPQLSQVVSKDQRRMAAYIANRLTEVESLITAQSGQMMITKSFASGNFPKVAEITEHAIAEETSVLGEKLATTKQQVSQLSDEIADKAGLLDKTLQSDIVAPQSKSVDQLARNELKSAGEMIEGIVPAFASAEQIFDELMRMIIGKLDEAPAPSAPGEAPELDALLAMLQDEMKATEGLGIPCRPINVAVMTDWMKPGSNPGMGQAQAQGKAAQAQSQQGKADAERLEKQARESAAKALAAAKKEIKAVDENAVAEKPSNKAPAWNKLASRLQKDLLQGRDNIPPEEYRAAIDSYFKIISETTAPSK
ncbi:MAG: hypothetical protein JWL59_1998 [Chthoniobacteraceae bacterium]|nr:hypothetical protein [Chthoniobacteraceae bacterium]